MLSGWGSSRETPGRAERFGLARLNRSRGQLARLKHQRTQYVSYVPGDHVFISYITEDSDAIDELQGALEAADFIVWRDKDKLWPGDDWQVKIREAIRSGSFVFLACFSSNLAKRQKSYQFEELTLAAEEYRQRPPGASWLMTARLDECEIPSIDLGMGRTLDRTIHRADLFGKAKLAQSGRLIVAIQRAIGNTPAAPPPSVVQTTSEARRADSDVVDRVRQLLRAPNLVMDYDDYLADLRRPILAGLQDRDRFPLYLPSVSRIDPDFARAWIRRIGQYDDLLAPMLVPIKLIAMYGSQGHEQELTRTLQALANESMQREGLSVLTSAHEYPSLLLTYAAALGALAKRNYSMLRAATADALVNNPSGYGRQVPFILTSGSQSIVGIDQWLGLGTLLSYNDEGKSVSDEEMNDLLTARGGRRYTPISDHLFSVLAPVLSDQFSGESEYAAAFDRVEVLLDAISEDARDQGDEPYYGYHGGYGRYTWRHRYEKSAPEMQLKAEVEDQGSGWTPLLGGLFSGEPARASKAFDEVHAIAASVRRSR